MPDVLLPDAEALLGAFLRAQSAVSALVGTRVGTLIPNPPTWPLVRLTRVGGTQAQRWEDRPRLSVECWADLNDQAGASLLARTVIAVLSDIRGRYVAQAGYVVSWDVVLGPLWSPDPISNRPRFLVDVALATFPG